MLTSERLPPDKVLKILELEGCLQVSARQQSDIEEDCGLWASDGFKTQSQLGPQLQVH